MRFACRITKAKVQTLIVFNNYCFSIYAKAPHHYVVSILLLLLTIYKMFFRLQKVSGIRSYNLQEFLHQGNLCLPEGKIVNNELYIDVLRHLRDAISRKRHEQWRTDS